MFKKLLTLASLTLSILITGCAVAPQTPVALSPVALNKETRVGVAMATMPETVMQYPGASCLLCYAAAAAANNSLSEVSKYALRTDDLTKMKTEIEAILQQKNVQVVPIAEPLATSNLKKPGEGNDGFAAYDFSPLKEKYNIDKLVVLQFSQVGMVRNYRGYFPVSPPMASITGEVYLVDIASRAYDWYVPLQFTSFAKNNQWDQAPHFPNLVNAYYQVVELSRDAVLNPLAGKE